MKKMLRTIQGARRALPILMAFTLFAIDAHAQQPGAAGDPFTGRRWQGRINYTGASGAQHSDLYEIVFVTKGDCIVTVTGKEGGEEFFQDADGSWSFDDNFFRLECRFDRPKASRLPALRWVSVYRFDSSGSIFSLLVPPEPGARSVRVQFAAVED